MTPSEIVRRLDQHVVGQSEAKKTLAVAVYTHYRKSERAAADAIELTKSNILLIGPTGTGKTLLCETLSRVLGVPFVTADAASLAQTEYVADEIEALIARLVDRAGGDLDRAQRGVVFIDEVDKLKATRDRTRGTSGESVQHALLKLMEGAQVRMRDGRYLDTTHVLFICGGAFVGLEDILKDNQAYGFISTSSADNQRVLDRLNAAVKPTDLLAFGLIPEFAGRLPIIARLSELSRELLMRILVEPKNAIYRQFREMLAADGVALVVERTAFEQIADLALEYRAGARSLRGIFETLLAEILYVLPDNPAIRRVVVPSLFDEPRYFTSDGTPTRPVAPERAPGEPPP